MSQEYEKQIKKVDDHNSKAQVYTEQEKAYKEWQNNKPKPESPGFKYA